MSTPFRNYRRVLSIATCDSGGGAGIAADLKTFGALGCYGMAAITAVTAQNTCGIVAAESISSDLVSLQIQQVLDDIGADAIKIGALSNAGIIKAVAQVLLRYPQIPVVLDPIFASTSGFALLEDDALEALKELIPLTMLVTPNLGEATRLSGIPIHSQRNMEQSGQKLLQMGVKAVLIKGGHLPRNIGSDCLVMAGHSTCWLEGTFVETTNTHGLGCTLSAAIAAFLAQGKTIGDAVSAAKKYLQQGLESGSQYKLGRGRGPIHHYWEYWP